MKLRMKEKLKGLIFALVMILPFVVPVTAQAKVKVPKEITITLGRSNYVFLEDDYSSNVKAKIEVDPKSVKVKNSKIAEVTYVNNHKSSYYSYANGKIAYTDNNMSASLVIMGKRLGTTSVSFKLKGSSKVYTTKVKVVKYVNRLSSLKVTGVNGGKNLASAFNKTDNISGKAYTGNGKIKITAAAKKGCKIKNIFVDDEKTLFSYSIQEGASTAYLIPQKAYKKGTELRITVSVSDADGVYSSYSYYCYNTK